VWNLSCDFCPRCDLIWSDGGRGGEGQGLVGAAAEHVYDALHTECVFYDTLRGSWVG
jgi:hypothetical protein